MSARLRKFRKQASSSRSNKLEAAPSGELMIKIKTIMMMRDAVRKKQDHMGKIPKLEGWESDPNPLLDVYIYHPKIVIFLVKTKNVPEVLK